MRKEKKKMKTVRISFMCDQKLHDKFFGLARLNGLYPAAVLRAFMLKYIQEKEKDIVNVSRKIVADADAAARRELESENYTSQEIAGTQDVSTESKKAK
jgi:hypothetical protein